MLSTHWCDANMINALQRKCLANLARGYTAEETAKLIKVQQKTIVRWLLTTEFTQELSKAEQAFQNSIQAGLRKLAPKAIDAIDQVLSQNKNMVAKLRAAQVVLENIKPPEVVRKDSETIEILFDPTGARGEREFELSELGEPEPNEA